METPLSFIDLSILFFNRWTETRTTGKNMHTCIETFLRGVDYNQVLVDPRIAGHWLSLSSILKSVQNARALESFVLHPHLKYKGVFDCVASYK